MKYIVEYKKFQKRNVQPINEGLAQNVVTDLVQFLISGAAEYGITAATLGVGTPAAVAVETMIDASFAAGSIGLAVKQVVDMKSQGFFKEFKDIINRCLDSYKTFKEEKFEEFYNEIKTSLIDGLKLIKVSEKNVDKLAQNLRNKISNFISKLVDSITKGLKILIPDAALGLALSTALNGALTILSNNTYNLATGAVRRLGEFKKYLLDPEELPKLMKQSLVELRKLINDFKMKIKKLGWVEAVKLFGMKGVALKNLGPTGLDTLRQMIDKSEPKVLELIEKILTVIVPVTFTLLAIHQILMKGEYKADNKEVKTEDK